MKHLVEEKKEPVWVVLNNEKHLIEEKYGEGLIGLMGQRVTLMCANYFYTGKLVGVNESCVKLIDGGIVYETGSWDTRDWKDYQAIDGDIYVNQSFIESFGVRK